MNKLIKHYDFTKMSVLPRTDFNVEVGDKWANRELQRYVDQPENLFFRDGLVLRATRSEEGIYSSVRINTKHKFFFKFGKVEIVAKLPTGKGTWPALWMLSETAPYGRWPLSGEIDIMEHVGNNPDNILLSLHTEKYNHTRLERFAFNRTIPGITADFHKYGIIWEPDAITYYIDDVEMVRYNRSDKEDTTHSGWPFDHEFYLILNLAIGGILGGEVDDSCFPQEFIVKDIKVWQ